VSNSTGAIILLALAVIIAGGLGSVIRLVLSHWHGRLPWGILTGNTVASIVVGFGSSLGNTSAGGYSLNLVLSLGLAGGLSTFSSWAAQTVHYFRQNDSRKGLYNLLLNLALPVACVIVGMILASLLLK
jgi:CrcB protein